MDVETLDVLIVEIGKKIELVDKDIVIDMEELERGVKVGDRFYTGYDISLKDLINYVKEKDRTLIFVNYRGFDKLNPENMYLSVFGPDFTILRLPWMNVGTENRIRIEESLGLREDSTLGLYQ